MEQSVEMPLAAIDDATVLSDIVGKVENIDRSRHWPLRRANRPGRRHRRRGCRAVAEHAVRQHLPARGRHAGRRRSAALAARRLHRPPPRHPYAASAPRNSGPSLHRLGAQTARSATRAPRAELAERFALGGLDFVKDDHGLADQDVQPLRRPRRSLRRRRSRAPCV